MIAVISDDKNNCIPYLFPYILTLLENSSPTKYTLVEGMSSDTVHGLVFRTQSPRKLTSCQRYQFILDRYPHYIQLVPNPDSSVGSGEFIDSPDEFIKGCNDLAKENNVVIELDADIWTSESLFGPMKGEYLRKIFSSVPDRVLFSIRHIEKLSTFGINFQTEQRLVPYGSYNSCLLKQTYDNRMYTVEELSAVDSSNYVLDYRRISVG